MAARVLRGAEAALWARSHILDALLPCFPGALSSHTAATAQRCASDGCVPGCTQQAAHYSSGSSGSSASGRSRRVKWVKVSGVLEPHAERLPQRLHPADAEYLEHLLADLEPAASSATAAGTKGGVRGGGSRGHAPSGRHRSSARQASEARHASQGEDDADDIHASAYGSSYSHLHNIVFESIDLCRTPHGHGHGHGQRHHPQHKQQHQQGRQQHGQHKGDTGGGGGGGGAAGGAAAQAGHRSAHQPHAHHNHHHHQHNHPNTGRHRAPPAGSSKGPASSEQGPTENSGSRDGSRRSGAGGPGASSKRAGEGQGTASGRERKQQQQGEEQQQQQQHEERRRAASAHDDQSAGERYRASREREQQWEREREREQFVGRRGVKWFRRRWPDHYVSWEEYAEFAGDGGAAGRTGGKHFRSAFTDDEREWYQQFWGSASAGQYGAGASSTSSSSRAGDFTQGWWQRFQARAGAGPSSSYGSTHSSSYHHNQQQQQSQQSHARSSASQQQWVQPELRAHMQLLGLEAGSPLSAAALKAAFHARAKETHPDVHAEPGSKAAAEERFKRVQHAYQALRAVAVA